MTKVFAIVLALLTFAGVASATTVINRYDYAAGSESQTLALITPKIEVWAFNVDNSARTDLEIGRELPINKGLKAGGYLALLPDKGEMFIIPSVCYKQKMLGGILSVHVGVYVPLNNGNTNVYSRETSLTYKVGKSVEAGLAGTYGHIEGKPEVVQVGVTAKVTMGPGSLKFRWLAANDNAPAKMRVEGCLTF